MSHPDLFDGLMDWPLFGPKDGEIADLVLALADKGLRLVEIESRIKQHLRAWLDDIEAAETPAPLPTEEKEGPSGALVSCGTIQPRYSGNAMTVQR